MGDRALASLKRKGQCFLTWAALSFMFVQRKHWDVTFQA